MGLTNTTEGAVRKQTNTPHAKDIMVLALWFGLVAGLLEGAVLRVSRAPGWITWVPSDILWVSPLFDALLFGVVGLVLTGVARLSTRLPVVRFAVFLFGWMTFFDWVMLKAHIRHSAGLILSAGLAVTLMRWFQRHQEQMLAGCRKTLPWILAGFLLLLAGLEGGAWLHEYILTAELSTPPQGSPNILVIVVDTLRADHLSGYGYFRATSPNLDRTAQQGVLFDSAFSASSWTLPSHASLLTGRYPHEHGAELNYYDGRYPTIAQALRSEGYRTGAFSASVYYFCRMRGFGPGFLHFEDFFSSWADMASHTFYGRKFNLFVTFPLGYRDIPGRKRAPDVNREFLRWVDRAPREEVFCLLELFRRSRSPSTSGTISQPVWQLEEPWRPHQPIRTGRPATLNTQAGSRRNRCLRRYDRLCGPTDWGIVFRPQGPGVG